MEPCAWARDVDLPGKLAVSLSSYGGAQLAHIIGAHLF